MAVTSKAATQWEGSLTEGSGTTELGSGVASFGIDWKARSAGSAGVTTPEELMAAAHASCYAMALSNGLAEAGHPPTKVNTSAEVTFVPGEGVTQSILTVTAEVPGIDQAQFSEFAEDAKNNCPVSQAFAGVHIGLESATLL